jgi:hypothetical protein
VSFFLVVHDSLGTPVINHSNLYSGEPLRLGPGRSTLTCRLPRLPLSAGMYRVDLGAKIGDASVDILAGAGFFQVIDGDYYGTGHQPPPHFPVLVDASWRAGPDPLQRGAS